MAQLVSEGGRGVPPNPNLFVAKEGKRVSKKVFSAWLRKEFLMELMKMGHGGHTQGGGGPAFANNEQLWTLKNPV